MSSESPFSGPLDYRHHPKRIPLEGTDNFRDLGGYLTSDGRTVRSGLVYRSGHLGKLTDPDLKILEGFPIRKVVDFRGPVEKTQDTNRIPDGAAYIEYPVDVAGADMQAEMKAMLKGGESRKLKNYLVDVNRQFPRTYTKVFAEWIADLARNPDSVPQVFHCTAGKDRTGFAAAVLLKILGVDDSTIMDDYLLSEELMSRSIEQILSHIRTKYPIPGLGKKIRPMLGVHRNYLNAAFEVIDQDWGGFDTFVANGLELSGADIMNLRNRFLD